MDQRIRPPSPIYGKPASASLENQWFKNVFNLQDSIIRHSIRFFNDGGPTFCLIPAPMDTSDATVATSSTYETQPLASTFVPPNPMELSLEYFIRFGGATRGVYTIEASSMGGQPDATRHQEGNSVQCELKGSFAAGIRLAEEYLFNVIKSLLQCDKGIIISTTGHYDHLHEVLDLFSRRNNRNQTLLQIPFEEAFDLLEPYASPSTPLIFSEPTKSLTASGEKKLIDHYSGPIWLRVMDRQSVPFHCANDDDPTKARCAVLLLGTNGRLLSITQHHYMMFSQLCASIMCPIKKSTLGTPRCGRKSCYLALAGH